MSPVDESGGLAGFPVNSTCWCRGTGQLVEPNGDVRRCPCSITIGAPAIFRLPPPPAPPADPNTPTRPPWWGGSGRGW